MPLQKLQFRPGLNREGTDYSNEGGWYDGDKIRFRSGYPEKIGGWTQLSNNQFLGICRSIWVWLDGDAGAGNTYIGLGTNLKYYIYFGGAYNDITPIYQTSTLTAVASTISTVSGSAVVTIVDSTYTPSVGDYVLITSTTAVNGIQFTGGDYKITSVGSVANGFTVVFGSNASGTGSGTGGTVTLQYEYPSGLNVYSIGTGWGTGPWSRGTWSSSYSAGVGQQLRLWSSDNFGADLVIAPRGGPIFYWADSTGVATRAQYLSNIANTTISYVDSGTSFAGSATSITVSSSAAPNLYPYMVITGANLPANTKIASNYITGATTVPITTTTSGASSGNYSFSYAGAFVPTQTYQVITSAIQEFVIAFGANSYSPNNSATTFNPMLVRWSDQANAYQWVPQLTNQSGEYLLTNGSYIMGARATRQEILVWTDSCLYSMQYLGAPYVWGFQILMDNISIISPNSMITVNNVTYWMGRDRFYMYSGRVETLPCSLRQYIFSDINQQQAYQVFTGANEAFNEVWWFYVSEESLDFSVDRYVIYNYLDRVWYYGTFNTTQTPAGSFVVGQQYVISTVGTTNFQLIGASSNTVGTYFIATGAGSGTGTAWGLNGRSAWMQTGTQPYPIAADYNGRLLYHENGCDDQATTNPQPIDSFVQSSDFDIGDGHNFGFVWRILPDVNFNGSTTNQPYVTMTVKPRENSGTAYGQADNPQVISSQNYTVLPQYTVQQFTGQVYTRLRGRQMSFRIESMGQLGVTWQLGSPRIDIRPDGRR